VDDRGVGVRFPVGAQGADRLWGSLFSNPLSAVRFFRYSDEYQNPGGDDSGSQLGYYGNFKENVF
jgi:hypothetical protein